MSLDDQFAFYTLVPRVRDPSNLVWSSSCCNGNWRVRSGNSWLTLTPTNTRVRDADDKRWVEICQGHIVEVSSGYAYDCNAYSLPLQETRSRAGDNMDNVAVWQNAVHGQMLDIKNSSTKVVVLYHINKELRLHVKYARVFDDFPIAIVDSLSYHMDVNDTTAVVYNNHITYTVNLAARSVGISSNGNNYQDSMPTVNYFPGGYSSFSPGILTITFNGNTHQYPTGADYAFASSTPDQAYVVEVYDNEFHFARLRLDYIDRPIL